MSTPNAEASKQNDVLGNTFQGGDFLGIPGMNLGGFTPDKLQELMNSLQMSAGKSPVGQGVSRLLQTMFVDGVTPRKAMRLSDANMEMMYHYTYTLYNQGQYEQAAMLFRILMLLDFTEMKYMMGFAACLHRQQDYQNAAGMYFAASLMDSKDPRPLFYAADCYIQLKTAPLAVICLKMTIENAEGKPEYALVKERAEIMLAAQEEQMAQTRAEKAALRAQATSQTEDTQSTSD